MVTTGKTIEHSCHLPAHVSRLPASEGAGGRGLGFDYATRAVWAADPAHPGSVFALCIWQAPRWVFCPGNKLPENGEVFLGRDAESAPPDKKTGAAAVPVCVDTSKSESIQS